ncbi:hypothetical protein [Aureibacter tunicatorum]|uniref:Uncharacterized protein n=1 Tax=Aureibacter tunicatorum TaxID=866807 RepID=A0AAE3XR36_9BACT|nr:hypothetical protein [Aureibacter tunicatorum]MDR6240464.1 hypothetical protein [Aureibacter tunicatorum]BDD05657.1 hypothetical protein AUTU_31400 [Aureibacter tunicatorum]
MDNGKARLKIDKCRYCVNSKFDPKIGKFCGLVDFPTIRAGVCSEFEPDIQALKEGKERTEIIERVDSSDLDDDFSDPFKRFKKIVYLLIFVFLSVTFFYRKFTMFTGENRYTYATITTLRQESLFPKFWVFGGITKEFDYHYRGYNKKEKIKNQESAGMPPRVLVKYSKEEPEVSELVLDIPIDHIPKKAFPWNGIHEDSLSLFLKKYE